MNMESQMQRQITGTAKTLPDCGRRSVLLGATALAAVVAMPAIRASTQAAKLTSFRSTSKSWLWAPEDFAVAKGFFKAEGVDVNIVATERAPNIDALLSRSADIVLTPPDQALRVQAKKQPVKLIAGIVNKYASHVVVKQAILRERGVSQASPIAQRIAALKGLKLATTGAGGAPDSLFKYLFAVYGFNTETDVELVPVRGGGAAMLAALKQGTIDGFALSSPTSDVAVRDLGAKYLIDMSTAPPPFFDDFLYIAVATTDRVIDERGNELAAYYRGLKKSLQVIAEQPEEYKSWSRKFFSQLDPLLFERAYDNNSKIYMKDPRLSPEQLAKIIEFMNKASQGSSDDRIPASFTFQDWADTQFSDGSAK